MRREYKAFLFSVFSLVTLLVSLSGSGVAFAKGQGQLAVSHGAAASSCPGWSVVASPNIGPNYNQLFGVAAVSTGNVWAVGDYGSSTVGFEQTLIEHWNGWNWSIVSSPNVSKSDNYLTGVAAVSVSDMWAVGAYNSFSSPEQTLIEHWNGKNWSIVPSPNPGSSGNSLNAVAVVSSSDVWAVGQYSTGVIGNGILIEHWNGTSWNVVPSPNVDNNGNLYSIVAVSASNVWAVGEYVNSSTVSDQTLIEHWNGSSWSVVASPKESGLLGVAAISSRNVWAVGYSNRSNLNTLYTLIGHWDGKGWSVVTSPNAGSNINTLYGVAAVLDNNVWAVGVYYTSSGIAQTLIELWNGTHWSIVASPNVASGANTLYGVAAASGRDVWAVGTSNNSNNISRTLIEFYC